MRCVADQHPPEAGADGRLLEVAAEYATDLVIKKRAAAVEVPRLGTPHFRVAKADAAW
jgi:hypothetical protein